MFLNIILCVLAVEVALDVYWNTRIKCELGKLDINLERLHESLRKKTEDDNKV